MEAVRPFTLAPILIALGVLVVALPFLLKGRRGWLTGTTLVAAFVLAGILRVALSLLNQPLYPVDPEASLYRGWVIESSRGSRIIELEEPSHLAGTRALLRSDSSAAIGDELTVFGSLKEIVVTFRNPYHISWKWVKKLEGTFCEIRGDILSIQPGKRLIDGWRRHLAGKIDASRARHTSVVKALTVGDTTGLDEATKTLFLETGTSHILSISGSHLAVVAAFFFLIARFAFRISSRMCQSGADRRCAALLTIPFAILFMLIAGSSLPTIRATIMIVIYMLALFFERSRHTENALFLSALAILVVFPHSLFSPSFQLTFSGVLFIILVSRIIQPALLKVHRLARWFLSLMVMGLTATAATLPVVLYHFHGFNPLSFLHNFIAVPLMCLISTPLALAGLVAPFGDHLLRLSGMIIEVTIAILDRLNWGYIYPVVRPNLPEALLYLVAIFSLLFIRRRSVRFAFFAFVMPLLLVTAYVTWQKRFNNQDLCVSYLDVGLGDAMLVEAPLGVRLLIDGGGFHGSDFDTGRAVIAPVLLSKKISTLDYVVSTHPHEDHLGGLRFILRHFRVNAFAGAACLAQELHMKRIQDILGEQNIPSLLLTAGDVLPLSSGPDIAVLAPSGETSVEDLNDSSLVLRMTFGAKSFLFTGDIGEDIEKMLVLSEAPLRSSVLKVPHHGSRHSSTAHFIRAIKPQLAVLSVGPGIRGIPSREAIARYAFLSVPLYRTDRDGCVTVCTDGRKLTVERDNNQ
ncbi:MAG: DNA internalization-related competence protein ComEC/Rec2 [Syntrophorhabdaceae bacterium]|nr:DNA internalization-related competence protein ComEC/Rec2 [Syntrophorhabdaceae bacterium]